MTIYQTYDRQGVKYFTHKPEFVQGHDFFTGTRAREPKKGDRVIRSFKANVRRTGSGLDNYYPDFITVKPTNPARRKTV